MSYADFVTLLFAFFVVMYAVSSVNEGKYRVLSDAMTSAFGRVPDRHRVVATPDAVLHPLPPRAANAKRNKLYAEMMREQEKLGQLSMELAKTLAPLVEQGKVRITTDRNGVHVEIEAATLFAPGQAEVSASAIAALGEIARLLATDNHMIEVAGYTDDVPISTSAYPSNWELSSARASSVIRMLTATMGMAPGRFTAVGYGANRPVDTNETPEGRARNRRVMLTVQAIEARIEASE